MLTRSRGNMKWVDKYNPTLQGKFDAIEQNEKFNYRPTNAQLFYKSVDASFQTKTVDVPDLRVWKPNDLLLAILKKEGISVGRARDFRVSPMTRYAFESDDLTLLECGLTNNDTVNFRLCMRFPF